MKDGWIPGYLDTKHMTILQTEQILHNFEDQKIAIFLNLKQVNFRLTLVIFGLPNVLYCSTFFYYYLFYIITGGKRILHKMHHFLFLKLGIGLKLVVLSDPF